jgi:hypothetical protein
LINHMHKFSLRNGMVGCLDPPAYKLLNSGCVMFA